jgi:hypothetical protein
MMKRNLYLLLLPALALSGCKFFQRPARPVKLEKDAAAKIVREIEKERADYGEWLFHNPISYLAARDRIDFNLAYNPACAFSDLYNCPIPPKENALKVKIRAGEMNPHYHESLIPK